MELSCNRCKEHTAWYMTYWMCHKCYIKPWDFIEKIESWQYTFQKSSPSTVDNQTSKDATEIDRKDFWKKMLQYMRTEFQFFMNEWNWEKIANFLSSNWYL